MKCSYTAVQQALFHVEIEMLRHSPALRKDVRVKSTVRAKHDRASDQEWDPQVLRVECAMRMYQVGPERAETPNGLYGHAAHDNAAKLTRPLRAPRYDGHITAYRHGAVQGWARGFRSGDSNLRTETSLALGQAKDPVRDATSTQTV